MKIKQQPPITRNFNTQNHLWLEKRPTFYQANTFYVHDYMKSQVAVLMLLTLVTAQKIINTSYLGRSIHIFPDNQLFINSFCVYISCSCRKCTDFLDFLTIFYLLIQHREIFNETISEKVSYLKKKISKCLIYYFKENFMSEGQYLYAERGVVMLIDLIKAFE